MRSGPILATLNGFKKKGIGVSASSAGAYNSMLNLDQARVHLKLAYSFFASG